MRDDALPLVLLGGTLCDEALWQPMLQAAPRLAARACVADYSPHASAQAAAQDLLRTLPPRFAVAGFSLGGFVALALQARAPGRVAALSLIATNARADAPANAQARRQAVADAARVGVGAYVRRALWPSYVAPGRLHDASLQAGIAAMAERVGLETFRRQVDIALSRPDSLPRLPAIDVPTLIVSGEHDVLNPADRQREMAQGIPGSRWIALPDVGHFVPLEAPGMLAGALQAWLDPAAAGARPTYRAPGHPGIR
ncbi:alpha/beta fold hydrolase [Bordetella sp. 2513F-2]